MGYLQNIGRALLGKPGLRAESSYHAAATTRRMATWQPSHEHVNSLLSGSGDMIRARARERIRNDGLAAGAKGVTFGRNIWQAADPARVIAALKHIIHKKGTVNEAMDIYGG